MPPVAKLTYSWILKVSFTYSDENDFYTIQILNVQLNNENHSMVTSTEYLERFCEE